MIAVNVPPPDGRARTEDWNPAAAVGLTCPDCHPERRDAVPAARPADGGRGTARREVHDDGADGPSTGPDPSGASATA
ncbi:hypothetical protein [Streptomyces prasinopilosus]|uniref:hypothetical protein n=1 Tax=Streptomyces prasinopilosus TaxID=67344 RepID=UPI0006EBD0CC|nr:hypothetical protein [Streptomyces prasinopilosus]